MARVSCSGAAIALALIALALIALASGARADMAPESLESDANATISPEEAEYKSALDHAIGEFNAGHFFEARILFLKAHALRPSARTWRALGMAEHELRHYAACVAALRQALADTRRPLTVDQRAEVARTLALAESLIAVYSVTGAEGALSVDGRPAVLSEAGELLFDPGAHRIEADGRALEIDVQGGERGTLHLETATAITTSSPLAAPVAAPPASASAQRAQHAAFPWPQAILAGGGAVLMISGGIVGLLALHAEREFDNACPSSRKVCDGGAQAKGERADGLALASDVLWISGAAAAASGVIWWLATRKHGESATAQARLSVTPSSAGVLVRSVF